jgi:uncharacterized protein (TIGR03435 family)
LTVARGLPRRCGTMMHPGGTSTRGVTMDALASMLAYAVGRPIVNETGLAGEFDVDLIYAPDLGAAASPASPSAASAPSLFTALEEQLGLKLESGRGPVRRPRRRRPNDLQRTENKGVAGNIQR